MLTIGEIKMNIIQNTNRTEPTFRYLIVDSVFFGIPNTDVGIGIGFFLILDIGSVFSVYRPETTTYSCKLSVS